MARKSTILQGIPTDSTYDYMLPDLTSKDLGRDRLVSYTSTKIHNNRPKTFDTTKILEGYTLTTLTPINENASLITIWPTNSSNQNNTFTLKAARVRIPLIHDGFLPDPLSQEDVNKYGLAAITSLHPFAYMVTNGETGFFGIWTDETPAGTRIKIEAKDQNLTRFEIISLLDLVIDQFPTQENASNSGAPARPLGTVGSAGGEPSGRNNECNITKDQAWNTVKRVATEWASQNGITNVNALLAVLYGNAQAESGFNPCIKGDITRGTSWGLFQLNISERAAGGMILNGKIQVDGVSGTKQTPGDPQKFLDPELNTKSILAVAKRVRPFMTEAQKPQPDVSKLTSLFVQHVENPKDWNTKAVGRISSANQWYDKNKGTDYNTEYATSSTSEADSDIEQQLAQLTGYEESY